eukprot:scaffold22485_cov70-Phaeocystis_antarctica.AAC.2
MQPRVIELRAHSKWSSPVRAPSKSRSSVVRKSGRSAACLQGAPPRSSAHPAMSEDSGSRSTVQLAAKATSKKSSSTRK